ncbi:MAG: RNA polymerase factor sigma-54 [Syntrophobacterales bacterium]|nr:RNA polymerase factor sigma-54 [Syntrophobacterales bacterium]
MAFELKQQLKLTPQLVMTPQLQQAIKLLQISRLELIQTVQQELEMNPVLEEVDSIEEVDEGGEEIEISPKVEEFKEVEVTEQVKDDFDWESFVEEYSSSSSLIREREEIEEFPSIEQRLTKPTSLREHLLWQLDVSNITNREREIGEEIIGNLNSDGYLEATVEEIAKLTGASVEEVEKVLRIVQLFDPPGIAARDLRECLLIQAHCLMPDNELVETIIKNHLNVLETKNYQYLLNKLKCSPDELKVAVEAILSLDPRPGRAYSDEEPQYVSPDVFVVKVDDEFVVLLNDEGLPKLRVSPYYLECLKHPERLNQEARDYIQNKLKSANWLIKSIHQRQRTIYRVAESIVRLQREFFEKGPGYLKPMVLRDVAMDVGMHESTISRVTANKYMQTPHGLFEMKYFFNSSIQREAGEDVASETVKEKIRAIIKAEDPSNPYSDQEIVNILKEEGIIIARRTVAKYREIMNILPSHKRKKLLF